ncbi:PPR repeat, partial [Musa troglodytarum]
MWRRILLRLPKLAPVSTLPRRFLQPHFLLPQPLPPSSLPVLKFSSSVSSQSTPSLCQDDMDDCVLQYDHDGLLGAAPAAEKLDGKLLQDVEHVISCLRDFGADNAAARLKLEHCGVQASPELVVAVLSRLRNDWGAAFTFFLWAGAQPGYAPSVR